MKTRPLIIGELLHARATGSRSTSEPRSAMGPASSDIGDRDQAVGQLATRLRLANESSGSRPA